MIERFYSESSQAAARPQYEQRVVRAIRRIIRSVDIYSHKLALDSGVTVPQLSCLIRLVDAGPTPLKELARGVDLSPSTAVGIVDRLEAKGLVTRTRSSLDRRLVLIAATEQGRIVAAGSPSPLQDKLSAALDSLPELERAAIALALERIVELMGIERVEAARILDTGVSLQTDDRTDGPERLESEANRETETPIAATQPRR